MGHHINAIIGSRDALSRLIDLLAPPAPTALPFGLLMIPLSEERLDRLATSPGPSLAGFTYLHRPMADAIGGAAPTSRVLYVETDYFGGAGGQGAALFEDGRLVLTRTEATGADPRLRSPGRSPISEGLARLGVVPRSEGDEFDAVGLGRFRSLDALGIDDD